MHDSATSTTALKLSAGQLGMWLGQEFASPDTNFNLAEAVDITGPIDAALFRDALRQLVAEAETTRVRFVATADGPRQILEKEFSGELPFVDFSQEPDPSAAAQAWMRADLERHSDIARDQLVLFALLKLGEQRHVWYHRCHHIVMDGFGGGLIARRLAELYSARVQGRAADADSAFLPLATVLQEEADYRASARCARDRSYWMQRFADTPAPASLAGRRLPNRGGLRRQTAHLPATLVLHLRGVAQQLGITLPQLLIGTAAGYLYRMSGAEDLVFGVPVTARHNDRLRRVPAMVANAVPLRLQLAPALSLAELVRETGRQMRQLLRHQAYRYEELRRDLNLLTSNQPLFTTLINVEPFDYDFRYGDCSGTPRNLSNGTAEDLGIFFYDRGNGLDLQIDFDANPALYTPETLRDHQRRLRRLLDAVAADPQQLLGQVQLLDEDERDTVLQRYNATGHALPAQTLSELLDQSLLRHGPRTALQFETNRLSYAELHARSNVLARQLRARGVGRGSLVAIAVPRSLELVTALLAVLRCGAAYLPLDTDYPRERLALMLQDAQPALVLCTRHSAEVLPSDAPLYLLDAPSSDTADEPPLHEHEAARPGDAAYVIYTSGTTGRPKGVVTSHAAIVNRLLWMQEALALDEDAVILQKTPSSFDVSVWEFFLPLLAGARLVLAKPGGHRDTAYLAQLIAEENISVAHFVPSLLEQFLHEPGCAQIASLRHVVCSGEALPTSLAQAFQNRFSCTLHNLYGPTEAAVDVSHWPCPAPLSQAGVPLGRPIWNLQLYVLDSALQPLPPNTRGELYIAGRGLGEGYLEQPALTAERFLANPYGEPGSRMYRSGDIASWNDAGELEFHGRADAQIKLRGVRIEPGEIEAALQRHAAVERAAVILRDDGNGAQLVAYIVSADGATVAAEELRAHLAHSLPDALLPGVFVNMTQLPLSLSGKLDRAALPAPQSQRSTGATAPRTPTENVLAQLWAETFQREQVGIHDNFFELGGHSLLIVQLLSRIRERFLVDLPMDTLFQVSTIAELAQRLDLAAPTRPPLTPQPRGARLPLSFAQRRWWFLNHLAGAAPACTMPLALRLRGTLDQAALQAALRDVVERHESLRTVFVQAGDHVLQQALEPAAAQVPLHGTAASEDTLPQQLREAADAPFDLARELPLRAHLFALGDSDQVLLLLVHHIAADGGSLAPLALDLSRAYAARQQSRVPDWEPLPLQYADFALWQRQLFDETADDAGIAGQRDYWRKALADLPEQIALPWDRPRPAQPSHRGGAVQVQLDAATHTRLLQLARDTQASVFMLVQAALAAFLSRIGAGNDIALGCAVAGRHDHQLDALIGCFVNTLVLRTRTDGRPGLRELVARVRETSLAAYANQDLPFDHLVELLQPARSRASHPLFQVMLGFQNSLALDFAMPGLEVTAQPVQRDSAKFDLAFMLTETRGSDGLPAGISGGIEYSADLFDATTVAALARRFEYFVAELSATPDEAFTRIDLHTAEDQAALALQSPRRRSLPLHSLASLVERQARLSGTTTALEFNGECWSYAELNARANRLAHLLRGRSLGRGGVIAGVLACPRERVVAHLAVVKSGGAWLPLEPAQAAQRLTEISETTPLQAVVTDMPLEFPAALALVRVDSAPVRAELQRAADFDPSPAGPAALATAYVIYTSGSTGQPKGVAVPHQGLASLAVNLCEQLQITTTSRVLQYSSCAFDASVMDLLMAFGAGATLVLPGQARLLGEDLAQLLHDGAISHALIPPAALSTLAPQTLPALRCLVVGGEACSAELAARWAPGRRLINAYGPTEATICASLSAPLQPGQPISIGRAVLNTELLALDEELQPVAPGLWGELYIGGAGLALGYLDQPWLTAQRFIANPHGAPGSRLYRSGDLARWTASGELELRGRSDAQVKIRGFRVEPGAIEAALASHAQVRQQAVLALPGPDGQPRLVAYVAAVEDLTAAALRQHLAARLPDYMLPAAFVILSTLPLNVNGKLDHAALPPPRFLGEAAYRAPVTPTEHALAALWAATLGLDRVGLDDDFFELGGHSLLAVQLGTRIRSEMQADFPLSGIYTHPRVAELARLIDGADADQVPDLAGDAQLDATLRWNRSRPRAMPEQVFLTGATGFVGAHLLATLLRDSQARVICAVRARDAAQGRERLLQALRQRGLAPGALAERVDVLVADLEQPGLGLSTADRRRVLDDCDLLLHSAARVDFLQPYARVRAANVERVAELIAWTQQGRPKRLHHISTLAVIGPDNGSQVDEQHALSSWHGLVDGYSQSKWVADSLAREAQARGLPVSIYRLGAVTGDRRNALCNPTDLIWRVTRLYADLGAVPDLDLPLNLTPADDVATAVVRLMHDDDSWGRVYHLSSPAPLRSGDIAAVFATLGQSMQALPLAQWLQRARARLASTQDVELGAVLSILERYDTRLRYPRVVSTASHWALQQAGVPLQAVDRALLQRYIENLGLARAEELAP